MLNKLLKKLQSGGVLSPAEIAAELGTTEELVVMMFEELARNGYLEEIEDCQTACSACPERSGCTGKKAGRVWLLTNRGKSLS